MGYIIPLRSRTILPDRCQENVKEVRTMWPKVRQPLETTVTHSASGSLSVASQSADSKPGGTSASRPSKAGSSSLSRSGQPR